MRNRPNPSDERQVEAVLPLILSGGIEPEARFMQSVQTGLSSIAMQQAVAYYRVSTARQGRSGLGIDAQRSTVARFAEAQGLEIVREFVEAESGKGTDALDRRHQLAAALATGRTLKCPVIVAKLD